MMIKENYPYTSNGDDGCRQKMALSMEITVSTSNPEKTIKKHLNTMASFL